MFNLASGITSLTAQGLKFTNFDGNIFASSLVPVATVNLNKDIFDTNNGGLFYKFDTSIGTAFSVQDNFITNQSMTGANPRCFSWAMLPIAISTTTRLPDITSRELINVYDHFTNSTVSGNQLNTTAGLVFTAADVDGVTINGDTITTTATAAGVAPIYMAR